jgi:hypothetical protein
MDLGGPDLLLRWFERHLHAENAPLAPSPPTSSPCGKRTPFLRGRGSSIEAATRADLEVFVHGRPARPPDRQHRRHLPTRSSRSSTDGWPRKERSLPSQWPRSSGPSSPNSRSRSCPRRASSGCFKPAPATAMRAVAVTAAGGQRCGREGRLASPAGPCWRWRPSHLWAVARDTPRLAAAWAGAQPSSVMRWTSNSDRTRSGGHYDGP